MKSSSFNLISSPIDYFQHRLSGIKFDRLIAHIRLLLFIIELHTSSLHSADYHPSFLWPGL